MINQEQMSNKKRRQKRLQKNQLLSSVLSPRFCFSWEKHQLSFSTTLSLQSQLSFEMKVIMLAIHQGTVKAEISSESKLSRLTSLLFSTK